MQSMLSATVGTQSVQANAVVTPGIYQPSVTMQSIQSATVGTPQIFNASIYIL
jgi:hypothetical protein